MVTIPSTFYPETPFLLLLPLLLSTLLSISVRFLLLLLKVPLQLVRSDEGKQHGKAPLRLQSTKPTPLFWRW